jgi:peptidyl-prolyl cis-trans isomerase B (cyclophilin B)
MALGRRLSLIAVLALALVACGGNKDAIPPTLGTTNATTTVDADGCHAIETPDPGERRAPKPTQRLDPSKTYDVTLETNCGSITIRLAVKTSPATTASFVSLARRGFFKGTIFHRIIPGFVLQGGDPTGTGTGGPGYSTVDPPPSDTKYTEGVVAMAKTETEKRGTAGSQFFVVIGPDAGSLPPDYAVLGEVEKGLDVAKRIGNFGDVQSGSPSRLVVIEKATVDVG